MVTLSLVLRTQVFWWRQTSRGSEYTAYPKVEDNLGADCYLAPSQDSLYEARLRKLKHIIDKAKIFEVPARTED